MPFIFFLLILSFIGCGETVPKAEYDKLNTEYREARRNLGIKNEAVFKAQQDINLILYRIAEVSSTTLGLRRDVELGNAEMRQAEQIDKHIDQLKKYIKQLENKTSDKEYLTIIKNLKTILSGKEKEIQQLKKTIIEQEHQIHNQSIVISSQERQLNQAIANQAVLLFQAGQDLEKLADDIPDVSRKKNKKKIDLYQKTILRKALFYYEKASQYGYKNADGYIRQVKYKLYE